MFSSSRVCIKNKISAEVQLNLESFQDAGQAKKEYSQEVINGLFLIDYEKV